MDRSSTKTEYKKKQKEALKKITVNHILIILAVSSIVFAPTLMSGSSNVIFNIFAFIGLAIASTHT